MEHRPNMTMMKSIINTKLSQWVLPAIPHPGPGDALLRVALATE